MYQRIFSPAAGAAVIVLSMCNSSLKSNDEFKGKSLDGEWKAVSGAYAGSEFPQSALESMTMKIDELKYVVESANVSDRGELRIDATKTPMAMDVVGVEGPNKGKTFQAIFRLEENRLTVCYNLGEGERPTEFASPEKSQLLLLRFERAE